MSESQPKPAKSRYFPMLFASIIGIPALSYLIFYWVSRPAIPIPPLPSLTEVEEEVAQRITIARNEVLHSPRSSEKWGHFGMVLRSHDFGIEANQCFAEAEQLNPADPRWPYYRGLTLVLTDPVQGIESLQRAVTLMPTSQLEPRFRLIEVLLEQGRLDEAHHQLQLIAKSASQHPRRYLLLARFAAGQQDWPSVIKHANLCLNDPHVRRQAIHLLIEAMRRKGNVERANELLTQLQSFPPDLAFFDPLVAEVDRLQVGTRAQLNRAQAALSRGEFQEAHEMLTSLIQTSPKEIDAWLLLAQLQRQQRQLVQAERSLSKAVGLAPNHVEAWFQLGVVRVEQGDLKRAVTAFSDVIRIKPDHAMAHHNLAVCRWNLGDQKGAKQAWMDALRCDPDHELAKKGLEELAKKEKEKK